MSRTVTDDTLTLVHLQISGAVRQNKGKVFVRHFPSGRHGDPAYVPVCDGRDLIAALDELRQRRGARNRGGWGHRSPVTSALIKMKVGATIVVAPMTSGALSNCRNTARRVMLNDRAVWHSRTQINGKRRITRMPDGSPPQGDLMNPSVRVMAAMKVGDVEILKSLKAKMHQGIKVRARQLAENPEMDWRCENLANGHVRCRRTR